MSVLKKMPIVSELEPARKEFERRASVATVWLKRSQSRRPLGFAVAAFAVLLLLFTIASPNTQIGLANSPYTSLSKDVRSSTINLRLLVPATSSNPLLCETLLSAAVLGYPAPILINWGNQPKLNFFRPYASHIQKVSGIKNYLNNLPAESDDDVMMIIDGFDIWFQLRPEVMLERYFAINQAANERIIKTYGRQLAQEYDMRQTVVWGADKKCFPQAPNAPACYAVPNSTLPDKIFGELTDSKTAGSEYLRPRWLNSGTVMGPVKDLRPIFEAAHARFTKYHNGDRDQWYFGELFGEQEWHRRNHTSMNLKDTVLQPRVTDTVLKNERPKSIKGEQVEFHMGLDYENRLFHTNTMSDGDIAWINYNGTTDISAVLEKHSVGTTFSAKLPQDILSSQPPFTLTANVTKTAVPSWQDLPLATNLRSNSIPAMVHINGNKTYLITWWNHMWFKPYGKYLLRNAVQSAEHMQMPVSQYNRESSGHFTRVPDTESGWFKAPDEAASFYTRTGERWGWKDVCKDHEAAIMTHGREP